MGKSPKGQPWVPNIGSKASDWQDCPLEGHSQIAFRDSDVGTEGIITPPLEEQ